MTGSRDLPPLTIPFYPNIFINNQFRAKAQYPSKSTDLSGKVALITGANTGLGFEAACQILSLKLSRLILAVRSIERGEAAAEKLRALYPKATVEVWTLDMSSYSSIQAFTGRIETQLPRLDIAILNAGVGNFKFSTVPDTGHEEVIQINYLSTILLAILLLPSLKSKSPVGSPGRLTIVNAALSLEAKIPDAKASPLLPSFDDPKTFNPQKQYPLSKLLAHMFLFKLVEYVSEDDVIVNLADPGFVKGTDLHRGLPKILVLVMMIFAALAARNVKVGASTYIDASVSKGKESHGCFLMSWKITPFNSYLYTPEGKDVIERLWQETLDEFKFTNVRTILESMKVESRKKA